jgi:hypothetical protein
MANLAEIAQCEESVYEWAVDDPVEGGPEGIDNKPIKQLANRTRYLYEKQNAIIAGMPFGYTIPFQFEPTTLELATWRCLPLSGQLVEIALYQRLCDRKYVGDDFNDTADWWYKCDSEGNRTMEGEWMRVLDHQGLFSRAAGANSRYKMANDAPS